MSRSRAYFHFSGQKAALRFFDAASYADYLILEEILEDSEVQRWMVDVNPMSFVDYQTWAEVSHDSVLYAACFKGEIHGFIYFSAMQSEIERATRSYQMGIIPPLHKHQTVYELSFARRPDSPFHHREPGIISSALRLSLHQLAQLNLGVEHLTVLAYVDPENSASLRVVESAGFVVRGRMKYDETSPREDVVYQIDWDSLQRKLAVEPVITP